MCGPQVIASWAHLHLTFEDLRDPAGTKDAALQLESEEQAALILDDWKVYLMSKYVKMMFYFFLKCCVATCDHYICTYVCVQHRAECSV